MGQNNRNKFASNQVKLKIATSLASGQSAPTSFCFPFHSCLCPPCLAISHTRIATGPSHHKSGSLDNKYGYHSTSQSTARKSPANVRTPSVTSSEPLPKRPENPSEATAVVVGRVHLGPSRDQLLDHGGVASLSRVMQRRLAWRGRGCEAEGAAAAAPRRNKAYQMGCFSGWLGKMWIDHDRS